MAAAARLASSLELFELQRTYALAETATETKERQEDSETGASTHDTSADPNDDAAHGSSGIYEPNGHNASDAYDVSSADHAIPHAADDRKHASATATAATKHGEDAGSYAGTRTQHEWELRNINAHDACTSDAEDDRDFGAIQQCCRCRSKRIDVHDERTTSGIAGGHAAEGSGGPHQVRPADVDGPSCCGDGAGYGQAELRRCGSCTQPTSCNVEEVPLGRGSSYGGHMLLNSWSKNRSCRSK